MWSPKIVHAPGFDAYKASSTPHEASIRDIQGAKQCLNYPVSQAGYDAYLAGFCFVRTCHMAATISYLDIKRMRVLEFPELLSVVAEHENHVNLARAAAHHVNLGGEEPAGTRPPHLHVSSRGGGRPLDTALLANTFSR